MVIYLVSLIKNEILPVIFDSYSHPDYDVRHMSKMLPQMVKLQSLIDRGEVLSGTVAVAKLDRLAALLAGQQGEVFAELRFGRDAQGIQNITGVITATLQLLCQRCLQPMVCQLELTPTLAVIKQGADSQHLPDQYEPLVIDSAELSLVTLVEDELLLALPIVVMHPADECPVTVTVADKQPVVVEKISPFAGLAQLKGKLDSTQ